MTRRLSKIPHYPQDIENWWWQSALRKWPEANESRILNLLREEIVTQSDRFNKVRDFSPLSYGSRDLSILAYGNFFFPRTWMQNVLVLAETIDLRLWKGPRNGPLRILDLGSGSGSAGLAALYLLRDREITNPIELRAVDYSGKSLDNLSRIHAGNGNLWPRTSITTERIDLRKRKPNHPSHPLDLILLSSSLNEIAEGADPSYLAKYLADLGKFLKPSGFLVIIEPALKAVCQHLQQAATILSEAGKLHLHGPYFNGATCPFSSSESRYHSHEVRRLEPPDMVCKLNEALDLSVRELKFGFVLLARKKPVLFEQDASILRLISPVTKKKGAYRFFGIGGDGKERYYEIQTRHLEKQDTKGLERLERGDMLRLSKWESLDDDRRVRIPNKDAIEILWKPE